MTFRSIPKKCFFAKRNISHTEEKSGKILVFSCYLDETFNGTPNSMYLISMVHTRITIFLWKYRHIDKFRKIIVTLSDKEKNKKMEKLHNRKIEMKRILGELQNFNKFSKFDSIIHRCIDV